MSKEHIGENMKPPVQQPFDREKFREIHETIKRLREMGVKRKEYDLVPPFGGRRVQIVDDTNPPRRLPRRRMR